MGLLLRDYTDAGKTMEPQRHTIPRHHQIAIMRPSTTPRAASALHQTNVTVRSVNKQLYPPPAHQRGPNRKREELRSLRKTKTAWGPYTLYGENISQSFPPVLRGKRGKIFSPEFFLAISGLVCAPPPSSSTSQASLQRQRRRRTTALAKKERLIGIPWPGEPGFGKGDGLCDVCVYEPKSRLIINCAECSRRRCNVKRVIQNPILAAFPWEPGQKPGHWQGIKTPLLKNSLMAINMT